MKTIATISIRLIFLALAISALTAPPAYGQEARLEISHLDRFADKAAEIIDVNVDQTLLQLAAKFLKPERSSDEAIAKQILTDLKGIYVKRYQFETEGEYLASDVETIRAQFNQPGWARIANVRSKRKASFDVVIMTDGSVIKGLAVLAVEPRALTVVNVVGPIDVEKLSYLEGKFGIPNFGLERADK
ncbi:MAG: DUF4252 domain-containing protein [Blastocatellia bacterium]|nr:DUF4252 domain-containing protein [Blastocatellia bacterium]